MWLLLIQITMQWCWTNRTKRVYLSISGPRAVDVSRLLLLAKNINDDRHKLVPGFSHNSEIVGFILDFGRKKILLY